MEPLQTNKIYLLRQALSLSLFPHKMAANGPNAQAPPQQEEGLEEPLVVVHVSVCVLSHMYAVWFVSL